MVCPICGSRNVAEPFGFGSWAEKVCGDCRSWWETDNGRLIGVVDERA